MRQRRGLRVVRAVGLGMLTTLISVGAFFPVGTEALRGPVVGQPAPDIAGGPWINSEPLSLAGLRGRVVLVEFWTYG